MFFVGANSFAQHRLKFYPCMNKFEPTIVVISACFLAVIQFFVGRHPYADVLILIISRSHAPAW